MRLIVFIAALVICGPAAAGGQSFHCAPALRYYCANIHISCAGRSKLATESFELQLQDDHAAMHGSGGAQKATITPSGPDLILRINGTRDWVRLEPDGRYSQRIYRGGTALMSKGICLVLE